MKKIPLRSAGEVEQSAITGNDGTVNPGYLVLFTSGRAVILAVFALLGMAAVGIFMRPDTTASIIQSTGIAIGAVLGAYGALLGGICLFLYGDAKAAAQGVVPSQTKLTTSTQTTETKT